MKIRLKNIYVIFLVCCLPLFLISKDNDKQENTSDFCMSWSFWDQLIPEPLNDRQSEPQTPVYQEQSTNYQSSYHAEGYTSEGFKVRIGYDIQNRRIKTHYAKFN